MSYIGKNPKFDSQILKDQGVASVGNPAASSHKIVNRSGELFLKNSSGQESPLKSRAIADIATIKAIAATSRNNGDIVISLADNVLYLFDSGSAATGDDDFVLTPDAGSGRWLKIAPDAGNPINLTTDITGTLPIANGGTNATAKTAAFDNLSPVTTKGDLIVRNASNNVRLAAGADGQVLQADSTASEGISWADAGGGAGEINAVDNPSAASDTTGYTAGTSHTVTRDTSNSPLAPTIDTCLDISASASAVESSTSGVYYSISTLPEAIRNWKLKAEFFVDVPATDEWSLSVYDGSTRLSLSTDDKTTGATVLPAGFKGRFSAYFNSTSNAAYSVNFTCTSYSGTTHLYVTNSVIGPGIGQAGAAVGPSAAVDIDNADFTNDTGLTFTSGRFTGQRVGDSLHVDISFFASGTGTDSGDLTFNLPSEFGNITFETGVYGSGFIRADNATSGDRFAVRCFIVADGTGSLKFASSPPTELTGTQFGDAGTNFDTLAITAVIPVVEWAGKGIVPMLVEDNLSEWQSFTPSWTNAASSPTRNTGKYRRVGSDLEIAFRRIEANSDGSAASLILTLPNNYTYDLTKIPDGASSETSSAAGVLKGSGGWYEATGGVVYGLIAAPNGSNNQIAFSRTDGDTVGFILGSEVAANDEFQGTFIIPITQFSGSQNSLVGYSLANDVQAGLLNYYNTETVAMSAVITGTAKFTRVGNIVTVTGTGAWTWASATSATSTEAVSSDFRPSSAVQVLSYVDSGQLVTVGVNTNGTLYVSTVNNTFAAQNSTSTGTAITFSYVIT